MTASAAIEWGSAYLAPEGLIKLYIHKNLLSMHHLLGELLDFLDSTWRPLLEANSIESFAQVNGVLPGDDLFPAYVLLHLHSIGD